MEGERATKEVSPTQVNKLHFFGVLLILSFLAWGFVFPDVFGMTYHPRQPLTAIGVGSTLILVLVAGAYIRSVLTNYKNNYYHKPAFSVSVLFLIVASLTIVSYFFDGDLAEFLLLVFAFPWWVFIYLWEGSVIEYMFQSEEIFITAILMVSVVINSHLLYLTAKFWMGMGESRNRKWQINISMISIVFYWCLWAMLNYWYFFNCWLCQGGFAALGLFVISLLVALLLTIFTFKKYKRLRNKNRL